MEEEDSMSVGGFADVISTVTYSLDAFALRTIRCPTDTVEMGVSVLTNGRNTVKLVLAAAGTLLGPDGVVGIIVLSDWTVHRFPLMVAFKIK